MEGQSPDERQLQEQLNEQFDEQLSEAQESTEQPRFKTLGVRIDEGLHARLSFIAQLTGHSLADEIRGSIEARVQAAQDDPDLIARAEAVRAEMDRDAEARRQAIAGFFGQTALSDTVETPTPPKRGGSRRKSPKTNTESEQA